MIIWKLQQPTMMTMMMMMMTMLKFPNYDKMCSVFYHNLKTPTATDDDDDDDDDNVEISKL